MGQVFRVNTMTDGGYSGGRFASPYQVFFYTNLKESGARRRLDTSRPPRKRISSLRLTTCEMRLKLALSRCGLSRRPRTQYWAASLTTETVCCVMTDQYEMHFLVDVV